jgi:hypothetical protein
VILVNKIYQIQNAKYPTKKRKIHEYLVVGSKEAVRLVVGSKEAVRLVVGSKEDILPEGICWS